MAITLSAGGVTLPLDQDLYWEDENTWSPVRQSVERTITGALDVQVAGSIAGRPITLKPEDDSSAWMSRAAVDQLRTWAANPGLQLTLVLRGVSRSVMFRHQDGALEATPVVHRRDVEPLDFYRVTVRFMEI